MVSTPAKRKTGDTTPIEAINWNRVEKTDLQIWNRINANLWLPEKIALSNDLPSWNTLTPEQKNTTMKVFAGLTLLDTIQGTVGAISLIPDAHTPHEEAIYTQFAYMESVHARTYSSIFSTLCSTKEIDEAFEWAKNNKQLQYKAQRIIEAYKGDDPIKKKIASVMLESFLFYSGFFWPFWLSSRGKLTNTADAIRLILRDEAVHGYYIGLKAQYSQKAFNVSDFEKTAYQTWAIDLLLDLFENEEEFTKEIYDPLGLSDEVLGFLKYNARKAMQNLGWDGVFPEDECVVSPEIASSIDPGGNETHDFFSGSGSSYVMGTAESTTDDDWDF